MRAVQPPGALESALRSGSKRLAPWTILVAGSIAFRLPALINARGVHSDAAIVGLQAMHILRGEWSWFLWGAGYQASFDALLVALGFALTGASALTLMAVPFAGHLLLTAAAYDVVRRRLGAWGGVLACLPLVLAPQPINGVALYAPRQWAMTSAFAAVWFIDRAAGRARAWAWLAAGAFFAGFAVYLDLFTMQVMLGVGAFALYRALEGWGRPALPRLAGLAAGGLLGAAVIAWSRMQPMANAAKAELVLSRVGQNWQLLSGTCLPYLLGAKVFVPGRNLYPDLWTAPWPVAVVQWLGATSLLVAVAWAAGVALMPRAPREVRVLGGLGALVTASAVAGFLASTMPSDMWSARYLAPIVWFAPFSLVPAAWALRARRFGVTLAPYLATAAIGGWMAFGPYVRGPLPVRDPRGVAEDEAEVGRVLRERGVHYAAAQYWLSYRLTFLFHEDPVVIPLSRWEDRYPPYVAGFASAPVIAFIFHPSEPRAVPEPYEAALRQAGARYERLEVRGFTVLLQPRR